MALLGQLIGNALSDNPQSYGDVLSNYASDRVDEATDRFGNVKPKSTTINYNEDGTQTVTTKHEVAPVEPAPAVPQATAAPQQQAAPLAQPTVPVAAPVAPMPAAQQPPQQVGQPTFSDIQGQETQQLQRSPVQQPITQFAPEVPRQPAAPVEPQQAAPAPQAPAPVAPQAPQPQLRQFQTPQLTPQAQAPMQAPAPAAAPQPQVQPAPEWSKGLVDIQNDPTKLAAYVGNESNPEEARKMAADRWRSLDDEERKKREAQQQIVSAFSGDAKAQNQLMRDLRAKSEEGSYLKAYMFQRLGLTDLSREEQKKLSSGTTIQALTGPDGKHYTAEYTAMGDIRRAYDADGNAVSDNTLAKLNAEAYTQKGAVTGQTFGKDAQGNVISHTVLPNGRGVVWKDETNQKVLSSAPQGYHSMGQKSLEETEAFKAVGVAGQIETKMRKANADASLMGLPAPYSEAQISEAKAKITKSAAPAGTIGADLSEGLQGKISSAQRTPEQGQALWNESVAAGRPGVTAQGMPIAKPGTSMHERNGAIDIPPKALTKDDRVELAQKGYYQPHGTDSVHWERVPGAATPTSTAAASNPTTTTAPTAGKPSSIAEKIANYEMKPPASRSATYGPLMAEVARINPDYDETKYDTVKQARKNFTVGKQGDTLRSMNVAIDHLDTLQDAAVALQNGNLPLFNKIGNDYAKNTGESAPTNFDLTKKIVSNEVAKAIVGGTTALADRQELAETISRANSPEQLAGAIKQAQKLLAGQVNGLRSQYEEAGLKDFDKKLLPRTKKVLGTLDRGEQTANTRSNW